MVGLGHELGLTVVAEGVETAEVRRPRPEPQPWRSTATSTTSAAAASSPT